MIRDRFILLFIIPILSTLVDNVIAVEATSINSVSQQTITAVNSIQIAENSIPIENPDRLGNSDRPSEQDDLDNSTAEKPFEIDKRLGLVGIAVVSVISTILLKFLFIPPASKISPASTVKTKGSKAIKNNGDREIIDTPDSVDDLKDMLKPTEILPDPVMSSDREQYVIEETVENSEIISQPTVLTSNTTRIDVVVELIKYLQQPDDDLRREAILELAQIGDSRGIEPLTEILSQVNSTDRSLVVKAIAQITKRSFQPLEDLLFSNLDDANPEIRQNAIRDLAAVHAFVAPITKQLSRMQLDRDMQVRQTAKIAIKQLNLCYFPSLFDDCCGSAKYDSNSNGKKIDRVKQ